MDVAARLFQSAPLWLVSQQWFVAPPSSATTQPPVVQSAPHTSAEMFQLYKERQLKGSILVAGLNPDALATFLPCNFRMLAMLMERTRSGHSYEAITAAGVPPGWCPPLVPPAPHTPESGPSTSALLAGGDLGSQERNAAVQLFSGTPHWFYFYSHDKTAARRSLPRSGSQMLQMYLQGVLADWVPVVGLDYFTHQTLPLCLFVPLGALLQLYKAGKKYSAVNAEDVRAFDRYNVSDAYAAVSDTRRSLVSAGPSLNSSSVGGVATNFSPPTSSIMSAISATGTMLEGELAAMQRATIERTRSAGPMSEELRPDGRSDGRWKTAVFRLFTADATRGNEEVVWWCCDPVAVAGPGGASPPGSAVTSAEGQGLRASESSVSSGGHIIPCTDSVSSFDVSAGGTGFAAGTRIAGSGGARSVAEGAMSSNSMHGPSQPVRSGSSDSAAAAIEAAAAGGSGDLAASAAAAAGEGSGTGQEAGEAPTGGNAFPRGGSGGAAAAAVIAVNPALLSGPLGCEQIIMAYAAGQVTNNHLVCCTTVAVARRGLVPPRHCYNRLGMMLNEVTSGIRRSPLTLGELQRINSSEGGNSASGGAGSGALVAAASAFASDGAGSGNVSNRALIETIEELTPGELAEYCVRARGSNDISSSSLGASGGGGGSGGSSNSNFGLAALAGRRGFASQFRSTADRRRSPSNSVHQPPPPPPLVGVSRQPRNSESALTDPLHLAASGGPLVPPGALGPMTLPIDRRKSACEPPWERYEQQQQVLPQTSGSSNPQMWPPGSFTPAQQQAGTTSGAGGTLAGLAGGSVGSGTISPAPFGGMLGGALLAAAPPALGDGGGGGGYHGGGGGAAGPPVLSGSSALLSQQQLAATAAAYGLDMSVPGFNQGVINMLSGMNLSGQQQVQQDQQLPGNSSGNNSNMNVSSMAQMHLMAVGQQQQQMQQLQQQQQHAAMMAHSAQQQQYQGGGPSLQQDNPSRRSGSQMWGEAEIRALLAASGGASAGAGLPSMGLGPAPNALQSQLQQQSRHVRVSDPHLQHQQVSHHQQQQQQQHNPAIYDEALAMLQYLQQTGQADGAGGYVGQ